MSVPSAGRVGFLFASSVLTLIAIIMLLTAIFSSDFRWVGGGEPMNGVRSYGLIRYCYEPDFSNTRSQSDDSDAKVCYFRKKAPPEENPVNVRQHYASFEITTLILLASACGLGIMAMCFAVCTIFTKFGAFAHSFTLLAAAICSLAGFLVYTFNNELMEHQAEKISGNLFNYHYGWAYYVTAGASATMIVAFFCSLCGSVFVLVHANKKNQQKVESIAL